MELTNADGSIPEMCGNGLRCLVKYAVDEAGLESQPLRVETLAGVLDCAWRRGLDGRVESVRVGMGAIEFPWTSDRPFALGGLGDVAGTAAITGNPHLVLLASEDADVGALAAAHGPRLGRDPLFPEGVNVELARRLAPCHWQVAVYERGAGLTQACGTGATAVAGVLVRRRLEEAGRTITIDLPGGALQIEVAAGFGQAWMEGPAEEVYRGVT